MKKYSLVLFLFSMVWLAQGQDIYQLISQKKRPNQNEDNLTDKSSIFRDVQEGLVTNNMDILEKHFSKQVFLSIRGGEDGYFSANQASSILQSFCNQHRITNFLFTTIKSSGDMPYATGGGTYIVRGKQDSFQVYVALAKRGSKWVIAQLNVY